MFPTADLYIQSMVSLEESMVKRRGSERCIAAPWDTWAQGPLSFLPTGRRCEESQVKGEGKGSQLQHEDTLWNKGWIHYWQKKKKKSI